MYCKGCTDWIDGKEDLKYGFCGACREKAFGLDKKSRTIYRKGAEMIGRKTCNMTGASAAEFAEGQLT